MTGPEPLRPTTARWFNAHRVTRGPDGEPREKWKKILAHEGHYADLFQYGTDTPSDWGRSDLQKCLIGAEHARAAYVDCDGWSRLSVTSLGRALIARGLPISHRGTEHCHWALDMRGVPEGRWPRQAALYGDSDIGHLKSHGFIPVPGSEHWSGELYEPFKDASGRTSVIWADDELLGLLEHAVSFPSVNGVTGGGGHNGTALGDDGDLAAMVLGLVRRAASAGQDPSSPEVKKAVYAIWRETADRIQDYSDPFELADFEDGRSGHYDSALRKAAELTAQEREWWARWGPGALAWIEKYASGQPAPRKARQPGQRKRRKPGRAA